jgi:hypothetical protein
VSDWDWLHIVAVTLAVVGATFLLIIALAVALQVT